MREMERLFSLFSLGIVIGGGVKREGKMCPGHLRKLESESMIVIEVVIAVSPLKPAKVAALADGSPAGCKASDSVSHG